MPGTHLPRAGLQSNRVQPRPRNEAFITGLLSQETLRHKLHNTNDISNPCEPVASRMSHLHDQKLPRVECSAIVQR